MAPPFQTSEHFYKLLLERRHPRETQRPRLPVFLLRFVTLLPLELVDTSPRPSPNASPTGIPPLLQQSLEFASVLVADLVRSCVRAHFPAAYLAQVAPATSNGASCSAPLYLLSHMVPDFSCHTKLFTTILTRHNPNCFTCTSLLFTGYPDMNDDMASRGPMAVACRVVLRDVHSAFHGSCATKASWSATLSADRCWVQ
ncbi:hypothetical protein JB92DRAFT_2903931 [Gautieria morchelliformis]|nr:hypothetical protein JB92DRAFT_2903931 [Gautieria morchelliformis]